MIFLRIAGIILIVVPIASVVTLFALRRTFGYPTILHKPPDTILRQFADSGTHLIALWYAFAMTAVLIIPMALFFQLVFVEQHRYLAASSAVVGALGGLVQAVGRLHWVFLVPELAKQHNAASAAPATNETVTVVFRAFHQYAGVAVGQHLGSLLTGVWTILISSMMFSTPIFGMPLAIVGLIAALGIFTRLFEPTGWKPAHVLYTSGYLLWSLWLLVSGVLLMLA